MAADVTGFVFRNIDVGVGAQLKLPVDDTMSTTHWDIPPVLSRIYLNFFNDKDKCGGIKTM